MSNERRENTLEEKKVLVLAALDGKVIQARSLARDEDDYAPCEGLNRPNGEFHWFFGDLQYKVKPEKKKLSGVLAVYEDGDLDHYGDVESVMQSNNDYPVKAIIDLSQIEYEEGDGLEEQTDE